VTSGRRHARRLFRLAWLLLGSGFLLYLVWSYRAAGVDPAVLASDGAVEVVEDAERIVFRPRGQHAAAALVFLPGAMVDPHAYAPLLHGIARQRHAVHLLKLPLRNAPFEAQRRAAVERVVALIGSERSVQRWIVAGHSLGGALAARMARDHAGRIAGLVLIGTSHPRDFDLSTLRIDVTKVSGTHDGLASPEEVKANARLLPAHTRWVEIAGGNHSQFGHYGLQLGDRRATVARDVQQDTTRRALLEALARGEPA
jgi:pimeloyl-ACP methyl ester carboxylesterase